MNTYNIKNFTVQEGQKFIFDTNIWISLMPIFSNFTSNKGSNYSTLLQNILDKGCEIGILNIEISEIFNVYIRECGKSYLSHIKKKYSPKNFKKIYRKSKQFEKDKNLIINEIQNIGLAYGVKLNDNFQNCNEKEILDTSLKDFDFNDNFICRYCEKYDYIFVTNDRDYKTFKNLNFTVVSELI